MRRWAARSAHRTAGRRCGHLAASSGTKSVQHGLQSSFSDCWLVHNDVISFCQPMRSSEIDSTSFCVSPFFGWQSWGSTAFCGTYRCQSNVFFFRILIFPPIGYAPRTTWKRKRCWRFLENRSLVVWWRHSCLSTNRWPLHRLQSYSNFHVGELGSRCWAKICGSPPYKKKLFPSFFRFSSFSIFFPDGDVTFPCGLPVNGRVSDFLFRKTRRFEKKTRSNWLFWKTQ